MPFYLSFYFWWFYEVIIPWFLRWLDKVDLLVENKVELILPDINSNYICATLINGNLNE